MSLLDATTKGEGGETLGMQFAIITILPFGSCLVPVSTWHLYTYILAGVVVW